MNLRSSWVAEVGQTREDTRLTQTGVTTLANPVEVHSGILPGSYDGRYRLSGFWTEGTTAMTATVSEGRAVIQGDITQGVYPVTLPLSQVVTFEAGDAQFARIDLIVIRVYDHLYDSSSRNEAKVEIIKGVPAATPQVPAVPDRSLVLYEVLVPSAASAGNGGIPWATSLLDRRTPVVSLGGILPVVGTEKPGVYPGQYQDSGGALQRWDGSAWVPYPSAIGGIAPANAVNVASYTGQYRDTASGVLQRWNGTAWAPAVPGPYFTDNTDYGDTTSTTYTSTLAGRVTNPLSLTFTATTSKIIVSFGSRMKSGNDGYYAYMALKLTSGATVVQDLDDEYTTLVAGTLATSAATTRRLTGLTPGTTYTLTAFFRVQANTLSLKAGFDNTFIRVDPLP
ncbi:hypothetical protein [Streptomyces sp. NPDC056144]|uniref:hypothetical protein n=1 Tax=unclassified Streptomyces TaxID=2593676 RepID=UPI0035DDBDF3